MLMSLVHEGGKQRSESVNIACVPYTPTLMCIVMLLTDTSITTLLSFY